jgi:predicted nucleic-acid-binding protein
MIAIDTNVLTRILVRDDAKQTASADKLIHKGAWVSHVVLAETVWVLDAVYDRTAAQLIAVHLISAWQSCKAPSLPSQIELQQVSKNRCFLT